MLCNKAPPNSKLTTTSFYIFSHSYSRYCLGPVSTTGADLLFRLAATWACSHGGSQKLERAKQTAHAHLKPLTASHLSSPSTGHREAQGQPQSGADNDTPPQGEDEGNAAMPICCSIYHHYGVESTREVMRMSLEKTNEESGFGASPAPRSVTMILSAMGVTEVFSAKPGSHPFSPMSLELHR